ncbi:MAG: hypothetical protein V4664_04170 [Patescibacteria group bacterium]
MSLTEEQKKKNYRRKVMLFLGALVLGTCFATVLVMYFGFWPATDEQTKVDAAAQVAAANHDKEQATLEKGDAEKKLTDLQAVLAKEVGEKDPSLIKAKVAALQTEIDGYKAIIKAGEGALNAAEAGKLRQQVIDLTGQLAVANVKLLKAQPEAPKAEAVAAPSSTAEIIAGANAKAKPAQTPDSTFIQERPSKTVPKVGGRKYTRDEELLQSLVNALLRKEAGVSTAMGTVHLRSQDPADGVPFEQVYGYARSHGHPNFTLSGEQGKRLQAELLSRYPIPGGDN